MWYAANVMRLTVAFPGLFLNLVWIRANEENTRLMADEDGRDLNSWRMMPTRPWGIHLGTVDFHHVTGGMDLAESLKKAARKGTSWAWNASRGVNSFHVCYAFNIGFKKFKKGWVWGKLFRTVSEKLDARKHFWRDDKNRGLNRGFYRLVRNLPTLAITIIYSAI